MCLCGGRCLQLRSKLPKVAAHLDQLQENGFQQWLGSAAPTWLLSLFAHVRRNHPPSAAHRLHGGGAAAVPMCTSCPSAVPERTSLALPGQALPLETTLRVWDCLMLEGTKVRPTLTMHDKNRSSD